MWCGLGDFDSKYGFQWDDRAAIRSAAVELEERYGVILPAVAWWDSAQIYSKHQSEFPHYHEVVRAQVVRAVLGDPLWYGKILTKRAIRLLVFVTPIRIQIGYWRMEIPIHGGILLIPLLIVFVVTRTWTGVKFLLFSLPAATTGFIVYSGHGMSYYSVFHLLITAWLLATIIRAALSCRGRRAVGN